MPSNNPKDKEAKRAKRAAFRAKAKQLGKSLHANADPKKSLQTSNKPVVQNEIKKTDISAEHDQIKQQTKVAAKEAMGWDPIFSVDDELPNFKRVVVKGGESPDAVPGEMENSARLLAEAMFIREKYMAMSLQDMCPTTAKALNEIDEDFDVNVHLSQREMTAETKTNEPRKQKKVENFYDLVQIPDACDYKFDNVDGVFCITGGTPLRPGSVFFKKDGTPKGQIAPTKDEFLDDYHLLLAACADGPLRSFSMRQLTLLEGRFNLHVLMNHKKELAEQKEVPKRDFYNVRKVDTHIHATACMSQKDLLKFMRRKVKRCPDDIVGEEDRKKITLIQFFDKLGLKPETLSVDSLDVHAGKETFNRFDNFNKKYNPAGQGLLRKLFLKKNNYMGGQYLAEQIKAEMLQYEREKYVNTELRISVHGKYKYEWEELAKWAVKYNIQSPNVRWMIQVPRLFDIYRKKGNYKSFAETMQNLFGPMFAATVDPKSYPEMHKFLTQVIGFDSVDDESIPELKPFNEDSPTPSNWTEEERPPYSYYIYYMYCNIMTLNHLRRERGMNTFTLRPHCGEAGSPKHLVVSFMLAQNISHGLMLRKVPSIQYLYYLCQMAIAMSPLSNNLLFLEYSQNPMPTFFARGLSVTLSTDDPLIFHYTQQPLVEEYCIATQVYKLTAADTAELARNSVLMCGFEDEVKQHWLGKNYAKDGLIANDISKSNVPNIRASFRYETLLEELSFICNIVKNA